MESLYYKSELRQTEKIIKQTLDSFRDYIRTKKDDIFNVFVTWVYGCSHFCPQGAYSEFELFIKETYNIPYVQIRIILSRHIRQLKESGVQFSYDEEYLNISQKLNTLYFMKRRREYLKSKF